jgi:hypothetical protein
VLNEYKNDFEDLREQPNPCGEDIFKPDYNAEDSEPISATEFLSKLMKVRYLVRTRPDIELACSALCTRSRNPCVGDMKALNKLLKYLDGTRGHGIFIRPTDLKTVCFFDAGFAVHLDKKSHSGHWVAFGDQTLRVGIH